MGLTWLAATVCPITDGSGILVVLNMPYPGLTFSLFYSLQCRKPSNPYQTTSNQRLLAPHDAISMNHGGKPRPTRNHKCNWRKQLFRPLFLHD